MPCREAFTLIRKCFGPSRRSSSCFSARVWLRAQRGQLDDDPVAFVLKDRTSLLLGLMMCATFAAALAKVSWA